MKCILKPPRRRHLATLSNKFEVRQVALKTCPFHAVKQQNTVCLSNFEPAPFLFELSPLAWRLTSQ
jgi:hypothetical protein